MFSSASATSANQITFADEQWQLADDCFNQALLDYDEEKYQQAIEGSLNAITILKSLMDAVPAERNIKKNVMSLSVFNNNLGMCYYAQNNFAEAEKFYNESILLSENAMKIRVTPSTVREYSNNYFNLSQVYWSQDNHVQELECFNKAIACITENIPEPDRTEEDFVFLAKTYNYAGCCYDTLKNFSKALSCFEDAVAMLLKFPDALPDGGGLCPLGLYYNNLSSIHYKLGDYAKAMSNNLLAKDALKRAIAIGKNLDSNLARDIYGILFKLYASNTLEHELFRFAFDVCEGGEAATSERFLQLHFSVTQSVSWQKPFDAQAEILDFMIIARHLFDKKFLPESPFKTYLENVENYKAFEDKIAEAQNTKNNLENIIGSSSTFVLGVAVQMTEMQKQIESLKQEVLMLKKTAPAEASSSSVGFFKPAVEIEHKSEVALCKI